MIVKIIPIDQWPESDEHVEPGTALHKYENLLSFACPGCGRFGSIRAESNKPLSWQIINGSLDDLEHLTLVPSINCIGCCGWHGYLTNGVFSSC